MKSILLTILALIAFTTTNAQTNNTAAAARTTIETVKTETAKDAKSTTTPATNDATAKYDDDSSQFVGTNDFYLLLVKEGVKKG
jgi:hypothetical protein